MLIQQQSSPSVTHHNRELASQSRRRNSRLQMYVLLCMIYIIEILFGTLESLDLTTSTHRLQIYTESQSMYIAQYYPVLCQNIFCEHGNLHKSKLNQDVIETNVCILCNSEANIGNIMLYCLVLSF